MLAFFILAITTIQGIDTEIETLSTQLHELRKEESNREIEAQYEMLQNGSDYTKKLSQAEEKDHEADKIAKRIAELQAQKQALLQQQKP